MLLRRITKHVKDQNWFAVGLDFLIVVVGVFIGMQVANWNDERLTDREAETASEMLIADLQNDRDVYSVRKKYYEEVRTAAIRVRNILESSLPASTQEQWRFVYDADNAGSSWPFRPSGQVYNQLLSGGKLHLVSDPEIMRQMRDYYQDAGVEIGHNIRFTSAFHANSRRHIDWELKNYDFQFCSSMIEANPSAILGDEELYIKDCPPPDLPAHITRSAERLHSAESLLEDVRLRLNQIETTLAFIDYLDGEAKTLISQLEVAR